MFQPSKDLDPEVNIDGLSSDDYSQGIIRRIKTDNYRKSLGFDLVVDTVLKQLP